MKDILLGLIRLYQHTLSRVLPPTCRFHPSCSHYSYEAISRYGAWQGGWLAVKRLARCHPFNPGGYDPVHDPYGTQHETDASHGSSRETQNPPVEFLDSDRFVSSSQVR